MGVDALDVERAANHRFQPRHKRYRPSGSREQAMRPTGSDLP